jgi:dTMP kinase
LPALDDAVVSRLDKPGEPAILAGVTRGRFITFEGGEGAGKSTQVRRLVARLLARGLDVVATREPGGSPGAEAIRSLVLKGDADRWSPTTETLLMYGARRDHIERTIEPALARGAWVICDRFADSTRAYQGVAGGVDPQLISALEDHVLAGAHPDLTLVFDLPVDVGLARAEAFAQADGHAETRFESKGLAFHERLRAAFAEIAAREPARCAVIDAGVGMDEVEAKVWETVTGRLGVHG